MASVVSLGPFRLEDLEKLISSVDLKALGFQRFLRCTVQDAEDSSGTPVFSLDMADVNLEAVRNSAEDIRRS